MSGWFNYTRIIQTKKIYESLVVVDESINKKVQYTSVYSKCIANVLSSDITINNEQALFLE